MILKQQDRIIYTEKIILTPSIPIIIAHRKTPKNFDFYFYMLEKPNQNCREKLIEIKQL